MTKNHIQKLKQSQVCYGDLIMLVFDENAQNFAENGLDKKEEDILKTGKINMGLLSTKGFVENQLYVQTIPMDESENSFEDMAKNFEKKGISNIREGLFRILPRVKTEQHQEYKKLLQFYEQTNKMVFQSKNNDDSEQ